LLRFEFECRTFRLFYLYSLFHCRITLLVLWCAGARCDMACSDEDHGRSRRFVQRIWDGRTGRVLGGWAIERSGGVVCDLHRARGDEKRGFLG
jgi:hypothetical protein